MNREIKFRAWDLEKKEWINPAFIEVWDKSGLLKVGKFDSLGTFASEDRFIIQQFTGLKDKNSVEIYEGDILDYHPFKAKSYKGTKTVVPEITSFHWFEELQVMMELEDDKCDVEVIGNIYENGDLLK